MIKVNTIATVGIKTELVEIEAEINNADLPSFQVVGLADKAVAESKERIRAAIKNSGIKISNRKIVLGLAPADMPKYGSGYDLAMAIAIIANYQKLEQGLFSESIFYGELGLDGTIRDCGGTISATIGAAKLGFKNIFLPKNSALAANFIKDINVYSLDSLEQLYEHIIDSKPLTPIDKKTNTYIFSKPSRQTPTNDTNNLHTNNGNNQIDGQYIIEAVDFIDIIGQDNAKRALEISAVGGHNVLLSGPPGVGKSMLAKAYMSILPPLSEIESIEVSQIYSVAYSTRGLHDKMIFNRPFRSPHHSASDVSILGGGKIPRPGEISLGHHGVLLLDEIAEFNRRVLDGLRQPLEDRNIHISRINDTISYPANFTLIATQNPCPCGYYQDDKVECQCSVQAIKKYQQKISGPIMDRIDIKVKLSRNTYKDMIDNHHIYTKKDESSSNKQSYNPNNTNIYHHHRNNNMPKDSSAYIKNRVLQAINFSKNRLSDSTYIKNSEIHPKNIRKICNIDQGGLELIANISDKLNLSHRALHKVMKISRSIADIEMSDLVNSNHIAEALQYR